MTNPLLLREKLTNGLQVLALWGFAVAQPLYDLLAQYPTFLVAHDAAAKDIIVLALVLSLGLPAALATVLMIAGLLNRTLYKGLHMGLLFTLVVLALLPALKKIPQIPESVLVAMALLTSGVGIFAYIRLRVSGRFGAPCLLVILVFPLYFILYSPVSALVFAPPAPAHADVDVKNPVPIVMVVFDEISSTYLLDESQQIDPVRYPNFAALADAAYWFPNATTVDDVTSAALPAILTGSYYGDDGGVKKIPGLVDYPDNLFTLFDGAYALNVREYITRLSPEQAQGNRPGWLGKYTILWRDMSVVYAHLVSPESTANKLPDISQNWRDFLDDEPREREEDLPQQKNEAKGGVKSFIRKGARIQPFMEFAQSIRQSDVPTLHFIHMVFPHAPFEYFPSGRRYNRFVLTGLEEEMWDTSEWIVRVGFQRHLLQLAYTDKLLGELINRLKSQGIYHESMIVITADHGLSFRPGHSRRGVREATMGSIMPVPLIIKTPQQVSGAVDTRRVEIVDILPTIVDIAGVELPWEVDGHSVFDADLPERPEARVRTSFHRLRQKSFKYDDLDLSRADSLQRMLSWFGSGTSRPSGLWEFGPHRDLVGQLPGRDFPAVPSPFRVQAEQFDVIQPGSKTPEVLPAYLSGQVTAPERLSLPDSIAVAVNGRVQATAELSASGQFAVMLPEAAFTQSNSQVEIYLVSTRENGDRQILLPNQAVKAYRLETNRLVNVVSRETLPVQPGALRGEVEKFRIRKNYEIALVKGWAASVSQGVPVEEIVIFLNEESVYVGSPAIDRPDLVGEFGKEGCVRCGFNITLPQHVFEKGRATRVFGILNGLASELDYGPGLAKKLGQGAGQVQGTESPRQGK